MKKILTIIFVVLYVAVGFISCIHACTFFGIANTDWMAWILAIAFELGQMCALVHVLINKSHDLLAWILMSILTGLQIIGNVFSSYQYMIQHSQDQIKYFTNSILFFAADPNPQINIVVISYLVGAILPIVALLMTSLFIKSNSIPPTKSATTPVIKDSYDLLK